MIELRGLTWKHDRGVAPMLATAARFREVHPEVEIVWEARSLSEFGEAPIAGLAERYDLAVLDHPYMGDVAGSGAFLALDACLPPEALCALAEDSAGPSQASYATEGRQWALAIDASAQMMGYRADLLERAGAQLPVTWADVFELARVRRGFVSMPLFPLDALLAFFSLCANAGEAPLTHPGRVVSREAGEAALAALRKLKDVSVPDAMALNPIAIWERMSATDEIAYCPLAFGYSNYARPGYRPRLLTVGEIPSAGRGPVGATLGGAGLAISARCAHREAALEYAVWVASAECQGSLYVEAGGQPASRSAWRSERAHALAPGFFRGALPVVEHAWLRPRRAGFGHQQNLAAEFVTRHLRDGLGAAETLAGIERSFAAEATAS